MLERESEFTGEINDEVKNGNEKVEQWAALLAGYLKGKLEVTPRSFEENKKEKLEVTPHSYEENKNDLSTFEFKSDLENRKIIDEIKSFLVALGFEFKEREESEGTIIAENKDIILSIISTKQTGHDRTIISVRKLYDRRNTDDNYGRKYHGGMTMKDIN